MSKALAPEQLEYARPQAAGPAGADDFPASWGEAERAKARGYLPDDKLIDAANVALILGQPLLLTGEPGTGKTQFAYYASWKLRRDPPLVFETKSTSTARDLFYTYDTIGRFHAAQEQRAAAPGEPRPAPPGPREFITYNALGLAIIYANEPGAVRQYVPGGFEEDWEPRRSVVLMDEIDKATRDFPNDILNEVENLYFRVPELGLTGRATISADADRRPLLILTSNSEKNLPDAFLRRCVYYHIPFPTDALLTNIVLSRLGDLRGQGWVDDAIKLFSELRALDNRLDKKPATAELLGWLRAMHQQFRPGDDNPFLKQREVVRRTARATLLKTYGDQKLADEVLAKL